MSKGPNHTYWRATLVFFCIQPAAPRQVVHTEAGSIRGVVVEDGDYTMFLGVPYAKVNHSNPFGASIPHRKFNKVFEANNDSVICPHIVQYSGIYDGDIDCLRINIYVPNTNNDKRAVFIYIFEGANKHGNNKHNSYGPKFLIRHDIIVVTVSYRLGPYGFLCTDHPEVPGNQGIKDQYTAIAWVKHNIRAFGGDPLKITLGGHSTGAMCVDAHLRSEQPRLFQQAIIQSGTSTHPKFIIPSNTSMLLDISDKLGLKTSNVSEAIAFLAEIDPKVVVALKNSFDWNPCVEKTFKGAFRYIAEHPEVSEAKNVDDMNILGGFVIKECLGCTDLISNNTVLSATDSIVLEIVLKFDFDKFNNIIEIIQHFYGEENELKSNELNEFLSDYDYVHPMQRALLKYSKRRNTKIYQYMFSYDGSRNIGKIKNFITESGAAHADELYYIFDSGMFPKQLSRGDETMINKMTALWANFIKYGNPTPETSELLPVWWPPLTDDGLSLHIDLNMSVISRPFRKNIAFWDLFFDAHKNKLRKYLKTSTANNVFNFNVLLLLACVICTKAQ